MAVDQPNSSSATGRRFKVGSNVVISVALVAGIVVVMQMLFFSTSLRVDMSTTGVNSLSEGSEKLLKSLSSNVRLTSLYFETELEEEDQPRYRRAVQDLIEIYQASNRGKIVAEWINPIKDQDKVHKLIDRLRNKSEFKVTIEQYNERIEKFKSDILPQLVTLVQDEANRIQATQVGLAAGATVTDAQQILRRVASFFQQLQQELEATGQRIEVATSADNPLLASVKLELENLYRSLSKSLKDVAGFATTQSASLASLSPEESEILLGAGNRYANIVATLESEQSAMEALMPLEIDGLLRKLVPTSNSLVIETDDEALVLDFGDIWPSMNPQLGAKARFKERAFKGEQELTAAIVRATSKEQTAIVFVRFGGPPLLAGGMLPGQPGAPYAQMKDHLEDINFAVSEWDVQASKSPPTIDPDPVRTIYVVFKPTPPPKGQFGQPSQAPPFGDPEKQAVLAAIGDSGRALFITGWAPGPFGPVPSTYEYNEYLKETWGVHVDTSSLLIETTNVAPGRYAVTRQDFSTMSDLDVSDHAIVSGASARNLSFPSCAPLEISDSLPEGVSIDRLITQPARDGVWGIKNIQAYADQMRDQEFLSKVETDIEGPFDLAVSGVNGEAKVVVVSAIHFALDSVAFARQMSLGPQGFVLRAINPGNVALFVNSMHWLNDNEEFMSLGQPIESGVLQIASKSTETLVQALTIFVWPAMILCCGGLVWWVRRR